MAGNNSEGHWSQRTQATAAPPSMSKQHRGPKGMLAGVNRSMQSWHGGAFDHHLPKACPFQQCPYEPKCRNAFALHMQAEHLREPSFKQSTTKRVPMSDLTGIFSKIWESREELATNLGRTFDALQEKPEFYVQNPILGHQQLVDEPDAQQLAEQGSPVSRISYPHAPNNQQAPHSKLNLPSSNNSSLPILKRENLARMQDLKSAVDLSAGSPSPSIMTIGDDKTPTDSGYGSVRGLATSSAAKIRKWSPEEICIIQSCVDDNMRTSYSEASGVDVVHTHNYVSELSREIYCKLQPHLGVLDRDRFSKTLPELIQAFSIKLGHEGSSRVNREIMYFMLRSYRVISTQLESLIFQQINDGHVKSPEKSVSSMSLPEKMSLWGQNLAKDTLEAGSVELSEGLKDDENTLLPSVKTRAYNEIILNSAACEWLVESLKRESSSEWDTTQLSTTVQDIRRKILAKLSPGNTSQPYAPGKHLAAFQLAWEPVASRLNILPRNLDTGAGKEAEIGDLTTVTASSDGQLQATKARDYLKQTWSSGGLELLRVLHNVFHDSGRLFHSCTLPDSTRITACLWESELLVSLHGTMSSIVECGEQLGWLASALRCPRSEGVNYNTPSITDPDDSVLQILQTVDSLNNPQQDAGDGTQPFVGFKIEIQEKHESSCQISRFHWSQYLGRYGPSVIVEGYPTARRPKHFPGLELSYDVLVDAVGPVQVNSDDSITRLEGSSIILHLINTTDGVCYWEEKTSSEKLTDVNNRSKHVSDRSILGSSHACLEESRHVIRELTCASPQNEVSDAVASEPAPPESLSAPETSIDSGMFSIVSGSVGSERPERGGLGLRIFKDIFRRLVLIFYARACGEARSDSKAPPCASESKQTQSKSQTSLGRPEPSQEGKRQRGDDEDNERGPPRKRPKSWDPRNPEKPRFLACPFWKLHPKKHCSCLFKKMTKIAYVKQHLSRRHTSGLYCQRCFEIFEDEQDLDRHVTDVPCTRDPSARLEVVSHRQSLMLSAKSKGTVEDQWYAMWHILFPADPRPPSIHVDADGSQDLALFREFSQKHGLAVMLEEFRARNLLPSPGTSYAELETILSRGLDTLFEHYRLNEPPSVTSDSQSSSNGKQNSSLQSTGQGFPVDFHSQDSGIQTSLLSSSHQSSHSSRQAEITAQSSHEMSRSVDHLAEQSNSSDSRLISHEPSMHLPELSWEPWQDTQMPATSPNLDALLEKFTEFEDE